jgi:hypothetical protein
MSSTSEQNGLTYSINGEIVMIKYIAAALFATGLMAAAPVAEAAAVKTGVLSCHVDSGWGLLIGSSKKAACVFTASNGKKTKYAANITKIGADVGYTANKNIAWVVMSLNGDAASLAGTYMGVNVEATAVVGVGANVLVGGLHKSVALQPVSVQGQVGLSAAVAAAGLQLKAVK